MIKNKHAFVALLSLFILIGIFVGFNVSGNSHSNKQLSSALCEKYGWESEDIKVLKHKKAHYEHDFGFFGLDAMDPPIWRINEKWVCEYKGREFNVEYTDRQFADDYQLEDIFKWCTEWLQKNVDPEIVGVEIFSDIIYHSSEDKNYYEYTLPWDTKKVFTETDVLELLKIQREYESTHGLGIFYKVDNIFYYGVNNSMDSNSLKGNKKYYEFCIKKDSLLSSVSFTKDSRIVLFSNPVFGRNSWPKSGVSFLSIYSLEKDGKAPYYVTLRSNEQYYGG